MKNKTKQAEEEITSEVSESVVTRIVYKVDCGFCGQTIKGTSRESALYNLATHKTAKHSD